MTSTQLTRDNRQKTETMLESKAAWISIATAVLLPRFGGSPSYISTDTVNLAASLDSFNPKLHQPQPPGYPLFVAFARLVHWFTPQPEAAFWIISIIVTAASAAVLYAL